MIIMSSHDHYHHMIIMSRRDHHMIIMPGPPLAVAILQIDDHDPRIIMMIISD